MCVPAPPLQHVCHAWQVSQRAEEGHEGAGGEARYRSSALFAQPSRTAPGSPARSVPGCPRMLALCQRSCCCLGVCTCCALWLNTCCCLCEKASMFFKPGVGDCTSCLRPWN